MLFDLKGRRRRVVQVTYVGLAVLMGGGLVLSGIGSDASGGLLDALVGGDSSTDQGDAQKPFNNQIKAADAWKRYMGTDPQRIDTGRAATASQIYRVIGLPESQNDKNELVVAPARAIAEQENSVDAYIRLVAVATQAGDTRTAGLAERKALTFAKSKEEEATIKERIETEKASAT